MNIANSHGDDLTLGEGCTRIMGVVNVTPDSFSDGGQFLDADAAIEHGLALVEQGADILDLGGESTRPGYTRVPAEEQTRRLLPVIAGIRRRCSTPISIDTTRASTARAALEAGGDWINDTSALREDPGLVEVAAQTGCPLVLMHRFEPPRETGVGHAAGSPEMIEEVVSSLAERVAWATERGVDPDRILLDPGLGFGTLFEDSLSLMANVARFRRLPHALLFGPSRKSFIGQATGRSAGERVHGTCAAVALLAQQGVEVIRIHDVAAMVDVVKVADGIGRQSNEPVSETTQ